MKSKITPKLKKKISEFREIYKMRITLPQPENSPVGPKKEKNDLKIKSRSKVRIERNIENESCSTTWVDPKQFLNHTPTPKWPLGPQKVKNDPKN